MATPPISDPSRPPAGGVTDWLLNPETLAQTDPSHPAVTPMPPDSSNILDASSLNSSAAATNELRRKIGLPVSPGSTDSELKSFFNDMPQAAGLNLGHYDVQEVLGRGGFGVVLKAFDRKLQRTVAIKMMNAEIAATSPARKRFLREARAAAAVRHENVVQIYTVEEEPLPYLVMEYIPGESLQQRLDRNGPLSIAEILRLGTQIARGLAAAHETKLVHRDIKPANILIANAECGMLNAESKPQQTQPAADGNGIHSAIRNPNSDLSVKLTDFGLARAADDASLTQSGVVAGTPMYMAPEQANAESFDCRADLFSLGSVLYVMASGRPPFRAPSSVAVLRRVVEDTPRPIREIIPEVPQWLCDVITRLHEKNPEKRYQSAREVAEVLADCQIQHQAHGTLRDVSRIPNASSPALVKTTPRVPGTSNRKWLAIGIACGCVAILAALQLSGVTKSLFGKSSSPDSANAIADPDRYVNSLGMEFVRVPQGHSWLAGGGGTVGTEFHAQSAEFFLGRFEVTQGQWNRLMAKNPSHFRRDGSDAELVKAMTDDDIANLPVDSVSWNDCQTFLKILNEQHGEPGWMYRLPTHLEWEYACRGGPMASKDESAYDYYFDLPGNVPLAGKMNFEGAGTKQTTRVGLYPPNRLGLHDMHGNVFEHCENGNRLDDTHRICGGCWHDHSDLCKACVANAIGQATNYNGGGLRVIRVRIP